MEELEDIFEDDLGLDQVEEQSQDDLFDGDQNSDSIFEEPQILTPEDSVISDLLKVRGIQNNKITIIGDNNEEEEVDFFSLDRSEQLQILNDISQSDSAPELSDTEIKFLSSLREENKSLEQFLGEYRDNILAEVNAQVDPTYDIDAYDDNELYLLDLKSRYDFTDEELEAELIKELQNGALFAKKVAKLRADYKELEDNYKETQKQEFAKQQQNEFESFAKTMVDVAVKNPELHGIELEDDEKNEVLSLLLDLDDKGSSEFYKKLNDPTTLYEVAWFIKYGKQAFDAVKDAYEKEIAELKKDKPKVVVRKEPREKTIHDLF